MLDFQVEDLLQVCVKMWLHNDTITLLGEGRRGTMSRIMPNLTYFLQEEYIPTRMEANII